MPSNDSAKSAAAAALQVRAFDQRIFVWNGLNQVPLQVPIQTDLHQTRGPGGMKDPVSHIERLSEQVVRCSLRRSFRRIELGVVVCR
jgi:hypothetical protein